MSNNSHSLAGERKKGKMPHVFVILFFLVLILSALTWIIPPGQFEYEAVDVNGTIRNLVIPGSFHYIDPSRSNKNWHYRIFQFIPQRND